MCNDLKGVTLIIYRRKQVEYHYEYQKEVANKGQVKIECIIPGNPESQCPESPTHPLEGRGRKRIRLVVNPSLRGVS